MTFVDTNFFLRFLLQDIKDQYFEALYLYGPWDMFLTSLNSFLKYSLKNLERNIPGYVSSDYLNYENKKTPDLFDTWYFHS